MANVPAAFDRYAASGSVRSAPNLRIPRRVSRAPRCAPVGLPGPAGRTAVPLTRSAGRFRRRSPVPSRRIRTQSRRGRPESPLLLLPRSQLPPWGADSKLENTKKPKTSAINDPAPIRIIPENDAVIASPVNCRSCTRSISSGSFEVQPVRLIGRSDRGRNNGLPDSSVKRMRREVQPPQGTSEEAKLAATTLPTVVMPRAEGLHCHEQTCGHRGLYWIPQR